MKKILALVLALMLVFSLCACAKTGGDAATPGNAATPAPTPTAAPAPTDAPAPTEAPDVTDVPDAPAAMSYADFCAAEIDAPVTVEAYIQSCAYNATYGNASLFLQDNDGGYYVYRMNVTPDQAAALVPGAKIKVDGYKAEWSGEVEIADATFEALDGNWIAPAADVTALLGTDALAEKLNQFVSFKGMTVEPSTDADGAEAAFLYNWDGSGAPGMNSDLYFNVSVNGATYNFTVESDECPEGSDVYAAVTELKIGDVVDLEGFLYWYEGANPHITKVTAASGSDSQYADFCAAEIDAPVTVEAYVQSCAYNATYGNASIFLQDNDGGYYVYRMNVTPEEAAALVPGAKIKVDGYKAEWSGEVEIADATFELLDGSWIAPATDVTALLGTDALAEKINQFVSFKGMTVEPSGDAAFLYNWDGSGAPGANSDLYFNVSVNGATYNFTVESDECPEGSDVYTAVTELKVGDVVDLEGFLYWYEGANPHITKVTVVTAAGEAPAVEPVEEPVEEVGEEVTEVVAPVADVPSVTLTVNVDGDLKLTAQPIELVDGMTLEGVLKAAHSQFYEGGEAGFVAGIDPTYNMYMISQFWGVATTPNVILNAAPLATGENAAYMTADVTPVKDGDNIVIVISTNFMSPVPVVSMTAEPSGDSTKLTATAWTLNFMTFQYTGAPYVGEVVDASGASLGTIAADGTLTVPATAMAVIPGVAAIPADGSATVSAAPISPVAPVASSVESGAPITVNVSVAVDGELKLAAQPVSVSTYSVEEALKEAHRQYYEGGEAGFAAGIDAMYQMYMINTCWGVVTTPYVILNTAPLATAENASYMTADTAPVKAGDNLIIVISTNFMSPAPVVSLTADGLTLTATQWTLDFMTFTYVGAPYANAQIVDSASGEVLGTTDASGVATLSAAPASGIAAIAGVCAVQVG